MEYNQTAENEIIGNLFDYEIFKQGHKENIKELTKNLNDANVYFREIYGMMITQHSMLNNIIIKLGFNPLQYVPEKHKIHDDNYVSPFNVLSLEESRFLLEYLQTHKNIN